MKKEFSTLILEWYREHKRNLPWRKTSISAYEVVVSEFMLQQTQVSRVIEKFNDFLKQFQTIFDLARANRSDVIVAWQGLGYNRRALQLHALACEVAERYKGVIPSTRQEVRSLPGVGPYLAGSILSFAYNLPEPAVDVNVRRIFMRYFKGKDRGLPMSRKEEDALFELVLGQIPDGKSCDFHNALMDFGSLVCLREKPVCLSCPLQKSCLFFPKYGAGGEKVLFVAEKRRERGVVECGRHIPNRIFRGRIVEWTRKNNGRDVDFEEFAKVIKKDFGLNESEWLMGLINKLEAEGIVKAKRNKDKIKLYLG